VLSSLGRDILSCTFSLNWEVFRDQFKKAHEQAEQLIRKSDNHRPVYNLAVVLNGLEFVRQVLALKFGDRFNARIEDLKLALNDITFHVSTSIMSEPAKVLNALALISNTEDSLSEFGLQENREYAFHDDTSIDIRVRNCWVKYVGWAKRKGISRSTTTRKPTCTALLILDPFATRRRRWTPRLRQGRARKFTASISQTLLRRASNSSKVRHNYDVDIFSKSV
jgi:hypothetical protein